MSKIFDNLYISGEEFAKNLSELKKIGITHIVNAGDAKNFYPENFVYLQIPTANLNPVIRVVNAFIDAVLKNSDNKVLVHCSLGVSRSCSLIIGYLMDTFDWPETIALEFLQEAHPIADPNLLLRRVLKRRGSQAKDIIRPIDTPDSPVIRKYSQESF